MGQRLTDDNIATLVKTGTTTASLPFSTITIGGQQYNVSNLTLDVNTTGVGGLDTGSLQNNILYNVFAVLDSGTPALVASIADEPDGYASFTKVNEVVINYLGELTVGKDIRMHVFRSATLTLTSGPGTVTAFDNIQEDTHNIVAGLNSTGFLAHLPIPGLYLVEANAGIANTTGTMTFQTNIRDQGNSTNLITSQDARGGGDGTHQQGLDPMSKSVRITNNQAQILLECSQNDVATRGMFVGPNVCYLNIRRIGDL